MEKRLKTTSKLLALPHCHLPPTHFPKDFCGKILYIERDSRAIAVSAFHMFQQIPALSKYMQKYKLDDVNSFARHMFEGKLWLGRDDDFNRSWKTHFFQNSKCAVLSLKYEGKFASKNHWIII